jgi:hypothetical protein
MTYQAYEINKVLEETLTTLTQLDQAITTSRGSDVDYLPNATTQKAYDALQKLNTMLVKGLEEPKELKGRGNVLDVMAKIGPKLDSPSVQTMLGAMAVEFSGMLRTVQKVLKEKDANKIEGTGFEALKKKN